MCIGDNFFEENTDFFIEENAPPWEPWACPEFCETSPQTGCYSACQQECQLSNREGCNNYCTIGCECFCQLGGE